MFSDIWKFLLLVGITSKLSVVRGEHKLSKSFFTKFWSSCGKGIQRSKIRVSGLVQGELHDICLSPMDCGSEPYGEETTAKSKNLLLWGVQHKIRQGISPTSVQHTQHSAIKFHGTLNFESRKSCDIKVLPTKILHYARFWNNADPQNKVLSRSALFQNWWENEWKVLSPC